MFVVFWCASLFRVPKLHKKVLPLRSHSLQNSQDLSVSAFQKFDISYFAAVALPDLANMTIPVNADLGH